MRLDASTPILLTRTLAGVTPRWQLVCVSHVSESRVADVSTVEGDSQRRMPLVGEWHHKMLEEVRTAWGRVASSVRANQHALTKVLLLGFPRVRGHREIRRHGSG